MYLVSDHMVMLNLLVEQIVQRSRYFVNNGCSFMIATTFPRRQLTVGNFRLFYK